MIRGFDFKRKDSIGGLRQISILSDREAESEDGAAATATILGPQFAAMRNGDLPRDRQAQTDAVGFGGEKGLENSITGLALQPAPSSSTAASTMAVFAFTLVDNRIRPPGGVA